MTTTEIEDPAVMHIKLPPPCLDGDRSFESVLSTRRTVRSFSPRELTIEQLSQLFWSCQGITDPTGLRTAPSAGATYPLEVLAVLSKGVFQYIPNDHSVRQLDDTDIRSTLSRASLDQTFIQEAAAVFILTAIHQRTSGRYRERTERYILMEVGHAAQNLLLQCGALGLGAVPVGAFNDDAVSDLLNLPPEMTLWYLIAVGHPSNGD